MKLSSIPNVATRLQVLAAAFAVWLIAVVVLVATRGPSLALNLGDTDDALRLTMVRELADGRGWFDQKLTRLQPPMGLYMHWSRLVDGGEALVLKLFGLALAPAQAEFAMRMTWPLLWILPVVVAVLLLARRLGDGRAVFMGAVAAILSVRASGEFLPGRIDHHNVQITCCMIALAAATQAPSVGWAIAGGLACALGLAVGLEAIVFHALIGAAVALSWAFGRTSGRSLAAYGAALAGGIVGLHLIQTPPDRWTLTACDALGVNLVAAIAVAGAGVLTLGLAANRAGPRLRVALLAAIGAAGAGVYLGLDPACLHGPLARVDPVLQAAWLGQIRELQPWPRLLAKDPAAAVNLAVPVVVGLISLGWLAWRRRGTPSVALALVGGGLLVATVMGLMATRSTQYAIWFSAPLAGAALADFAGACLGGAMLPAVALAVALSLAPIGLISLIPSGSGSQVDAAPLMGSAGANPCIAASALRPLARLPKGLVLAEIDEGPYILAETPHAVLQAPYHRMGWGIRQARAAYAAPADNGDDRLRGLGVTYVVDCPAHSGHSDRTGLAVGSLQARLDAARPPTWLRSLSKPADPLQIYALR